MAKGIAVATGPKGGKMAAPVATKVGKPFAAKAPPFGSGASPVPPPPKANVGGASGIGGGPAFKKGGAVRKGKK